MAPEEGSGVSEHSCAHMCPRGASDLSWYCAAQISVGRGWSHRLILPLSIFVVCAEVMVATKWDPAAFAASLPGANQRGAPYSGNSLPLGATFTLTLVAQIGPGVQVREDDPQ